MYSILNRRPTRSTHRSVHLHLETLEDRSVPSANPLSNAVSVPVPYDLGPALTTVTRLVTQAQQAWSAQRQGQLEAIKVLATEAQEAASNLAGQVGATINAYHKNILGPAVTAATGLVNQVQHAWSALGGRVRTTSNASSSWDGVTMSDWMKEIAGSKRLSELSIPGTHDTCALHGASLGAQCQTKSLKDQLKAGIRFIDIRCCVIRDADQRKWVMRIHHGLVYQKMDLDGVIKECRDFLKEHPGETIVMSVKQEHSERGALQFSWTFSDYVNAKAHKPEGSFKGWYREEAIPTLDEVRGKIVVVSREKDSKAKLPGIPWEAMKESIQDEYEVPVKKSVNGIPMPDLAWKYNHVIARFKSHLGKPDEWSINFCSAQNWWGHVKPDMVADYVNPRVLKYLSESPKDGTWSGGKFGTVLMDFPSDDLIQTIIKNNTRGKSTETAGVNSLAVDALMSQLTATGANPLASLPGSAQMRDLAFLPQHTSPVDARQTLIEHGGTAQRVSAAEASAEAKDLLFSEGEGSLVTSCNRGSQRRRAGGGVATLMTVTM